MPFSEQVKLDVKHKSAFRCCRCHEIGIEIHHILPQADGGSDDLDNAAPLCSNCHTNFGGNPEKRKEIRQMRDWWYVVVTEKYRDDADKWEKINGILVDLQHGNSDKFNDLQTELKKIQSDVSQIKNVSMNSVQRTTNEFITATTLGDRVHANFSCKKCGTTIGLLIGANSCPNCNSPIN